MEGQTVLTVEGVTLARRGYYITGTLNLAPHHLVFSFVPKDAPKQNAREIWICYPMIERMSKTRGSSWISRHGNGNGSQETTPPPLHIANAPRSDPASAADTRMSNSTSNLSSVSDTPDTPSLSNLAESTPNLPATNGSSTAPLTSSRFPDQANPDAATTARNSRPGQGNGSRSSTAARMDHYSASHIRIQCKDFTYYSFDFANDGICTDVFLKLSALITSPKARSDISRFYAFQYRPNMLESNLSTKGWKIYNPHKEYLRLGLHSEAESGAEGEEERAGIFWRVSNINHNYSFSPSYPNSFVVPSSISDNVLKHAGKFRSKQRIPVVVYRHRAGLNSNVIARCAQPLVGLKLQNRSLQDEKLIGEIFHSQEKEKEYRSLKKEEEEEDGGANGFSEQPQRNLIVDLRPITNAMAQHALGAGTESIDNYRGKSPGSNNNEEGEPQSTRNVDKIFCNIDNIHVMRDSLTKLTTILNDLDKYPTTNQNGESTYPLLQQSLTKTQWLHRLSIILQSVDRISKSVHLNNTNVIIHCSDGWDRTSQVSALSQLCLDPYYRTLEGFMVLVEKEWVSFGFKFATRSDHGGCIGAKYTPNGSGGDNNNSQSDIDSRDSEQPAQKAQPQPQAGSAPTQSNGAKVASFLQRAAQHIKNTAVQASNQASEFDIEDGKLSFSGGNGLGGSAYKGSDERSPIFHQFLDCVYQLLRQHPTKFEFNSRFLKRLFYHHYSCQYGSFLCNSERELREIYKIKQSTVSVWDYFNSRTAEFTNPQYKDVSIADEDEGVLFFNFTDIKWWFELYGRSDEEMNGLSNSLDRKFAKMKLNK